MKIQNLVGPTLKRPENLEHIQRILNDPAIKNRAKAADAVCDRFEFFSPTGARQQSSCLVALRELDRKKLIKLPPSTFQKRVKQNPIRLNTPVDDPKNVPDEVTDIKELGFIHVTDSEHRAIWNELMIREHPQGNRVLVGRQLRYLIKSEHGWLGGLGFSSCAITLAAREDWIGWSAEDRASHLDRIVGMSRFLIRQSVSCKNLASKVLSMIIPVFKRDYEKVYALQPLLLETFVDTNHFKGTCYQAANWIKVGETKGRGRQDSDRTAKNTRKDIYIYPLHKNAKQQLGGSERASIKPLNIAEGLDRETWAQSEFGGAKIGHVTRVKRLIKMAQGKGDAPSSTWPQITNGDRHQLKSIYRFIGQKEDSGVSMDGMLHGHREQTIRRMAAQKVVLCIQDSCDLNFSTRPGCSDLGFLGTNHTKTISEGLRLHSMLAQTTDGIPLGVLWNQCEARQLRPEHKGLDLRYIPQEEKETNRWIEGVEACAEAAKKLKQTMLVNISDREGDFFRMFHAHDLMPQVELVIRAKSNRATGEDLKLFDSIRGKPLKMRAKVQIKRQSARKKKGKSPAKDRLPSRFATVEIRYDTYHVRPPTWGLDSKKDPVKAWMVHVVEPNPPQGEEGLEWFLWTTIPVTSNKIAQRIIRWYRLRWRIEDWHRVLKSNCDIEAHQHQTAERLKRAIAIDLVVGYRIMLMSLLGREQPNLPATEMFTEIEIEVLTAWAEKKKYCPSIENLGSAVLVVAIMGGYLNRRCDTQPGPKVIRRGYNRLQNLCEAYELFRPDEIPAKEEAENERPAREPGHE